MRVLLLSPGFPAEMPLFTRALAQVGAEVYGIADTPAQHLPEETRSSLAGYLQVRRLLDETRVVAQVREWARNHSFDRVECLWEPGMLLAAQIREALGLPGLTVEQTVPFRDKEDMKRVLDAAGIRTPHHYRCATGDECRRAAEAIGFPLIVKPIDGAGSADTWRVDDAQQLEAAIGRIGHVPQVSVEEFVDGEEFTYDTVCANGEILFENIAWYRPKPLVARLHEWISPQAVVLRDLDVPPLAAGRELGREVIRALGFQTGFTHMEWYRKESGEAVFGEIGARPAGARLVHVMNYSTDGDLFLAWAEAVCHGRIQQDLRHRYNAAVIFKRAQGEGHIRRYEGLEGLLQRHGEQIVNLELTPMGQRKRDYRQSVVGDGWIVVRHPDLSQTLEIADRVGTDLQLIAGP